MGTDVSKSEYLDLVRNLDEAVTGTPTVRGMVDTYGETGWAYSRFFETWHEALRAAGIQPTHGVAPDVSRSELLSELKRLYVELGCSPTTHDIDEMGKYPRQLYLDTFESYIAALKEAGISPTEKQYRFSSVDTPAEKKTTQNIEYVRANGPTTASELPADSNLSDKRHGMWKFTIPVGKRRGDERQAVGGPPEYVYYLPDEHAPELVMRRFFEANPRVLRYKSLHGLKLGIRDHKREWLDIAREFLEDMRDEQLAADESVRRQVVLVQTDANEHFTGCVERSVTSLVSLSDIDVDAESMSEERPVWGFSRGDKAIWEQLTRGDYLLFVGEDLPDPVVMVVDEFIQDWSLAKELWVEYEGGIRVGGPAEPWPYVVTGKATEAIPSDRLEAPLEADLSSAATYFVAEDALDPVRAKYGSIEAYLRDVRLRERSTEEVSLTPVDERLAALKEPLTDEPPLTVDDSALEEYEREIRAAAFRRGIYELYDSCAVCGKIRDGPDGSTDLEAAHIFPKSESGPDILQNGLGLCPIHHWAFDAGWFVLTDELRIRVRTRPSLRGFEELTRFDGDELVVPAEPQYRPHPKYLEAHRELISH